MSTSSPITDRIEITDLFTRFARLLDQRRWDDAGTVFADDVEFHSPRIHLRGIDKVVDLMRQGEVEGERTQHTTTDLLIEADGHRAAVSSNSVVYYFRDGQPPHRTGGLRQVCTVIRTPEGWRISETRIMPAWIRKD
ncbi:nuclear transport factor 2 family protein [Nocardia rhamnosiphila]